MMKIKSEKVSEEDIPKKDTKWTEKEKQFVKDNWKEMADEDMAEELNRTPSAIQYQRLRMNLQRGRTWTENEKKFIKDNWRKMSDKKLGEKLGRTSNAVKCQRLKMNLNRNNYYWREKEKQFVKDNWKKMSDEEISNHLNHTVYAIRNKRTRMGLKHRPRKLTDKDVLNRLRNLAEELGRSPKESDNPNLAALCHSHFGSWNKAKEEIGLETFPCVREVNQRSEEEKREMVNLALDYLDDESKEAEQQLEKEYDNFGDSAEVIAKSILRTHDKTYLTIRDGWAESMFKKMTGKGGD